MNSLSLAQFVSITHADLSTETIQNHIFTNICTDSRRVQPDALFFALKGSQVDGHAFVGHALRNGAVAAVVRRSWAAQHPELATERLILVDDPLASLQKLAGWWRKELRGKVLAITGSNGKTIVKDALHQVLCGMYECSASPGSYNNQLGVPLSLLRFPQEVELALVEAGVSEKNDMPVLERMIRPDFGILTNIGLAHLSAFGSREAIAQEKMQLFANIAPEGWLLVPANEPLLEPSLSTLRCRIHRVGQKNPDLPFVEQRHPSKDGQLLTLHFPGHSTFEFFVDTPSLEIVTDLEIAACAGFLLAVPEAMIVEALTGYNPGSTRMETWKSPNGVTLINDSCSSDPISVRSALRTLATMSNDRGKRIFVFGGMRELGPLEAVEHAQVGYIAAESNVDTLVLIGSRQLDQTEDAFREKAAGQVLRCRNFEEIKSRLLPSLKWGDTILVKGPRNTDINDIAREITETMAPNRFIVDLEAINENITRFQRHVGPNTRILAMIKALAYGSDATRLAKELQKMGIESVGVASADEGVSLRKVGVDIPILVFLCTPDEAEKVVRYALTPIVYSSESITPLAAAAQTQGKTINVHLEVDTGMGRLGVQPEQALEVAQAIAQSGRLHLAGVLTHFACAEEPEKDDFTRLQISRFNTVVAQLKAAGFTRLICHAGATAGAARFPEAHFDMVRIGLGLYGVYPSEAVAQAIDLDLAVSLVSRLAEVRTLPKGHRIGYGGTFEVPHDQFRAGVVPIGYHDGIPVSLSNRGTVLINGQRAPIVGRVSMDSMIVDVSQIADAAVGSDVLIYGKYAGYALRPEAIADSCGTIAYELLARLGPRIQRIFTGSYRYNGLVK